MSKITVLGLGSMGSRMAINFAAAGHDVTVWNRTSGVADQLAADHGLVAASSPASAVADAQFVVSMVRDDEAAQEVWLAPESGALAAMPTGAIAVESSTLTPEAVRRLGAAAAAARVPFVEAPVVGSRPQADAGALFYVLGGDADAIESAQPIIDVNAGNSTRAGRLGDAATMKLAINGLFATQVAAYAEAVGFVERSGLDVDQAIGVLGALPITSPGLQRILGLFAARDFAPNFPVELVAKDLGYLVDTADAAGALMPLAASTRDVFERGADGPQGALDIAGIAELFTVTRA